MFSSSQFTTLIQNAFSSQNEKTRAEGQAALERMAVENPDALAQVAIAEFDNRQLSTATRTIIATFLSGILLPAETSNVSSIWPKIKNEAKEAIKSTSLKLLVEKNQVLMKSAANLVATVFVVDCILDKSWESVLQRLTDNVDNTDIEIQKAAVTTLGFICDLLNKRKITNLSDHRIDLLLTGICKGLEKYNNLTDTALQAFDDSIQFLKKKLDNEKIADFVMQLLVTLLREINKDKTETDCERKLIYILSKICRILFARLSKYYEIVFSEVSNSYFRGPLVFVACNHFFTTMVKSEEKAGANYLEKYWKNIMEVCLKALLEAPEQSEDDEASGSSITISVLDTMTAINRLHAGQTFEVMKSYITKYIEANEEKSKVAALIAFESLVEIPKNEALINFLDLGFFGILNFLQNGSPKIKRHSIRFLLKIVKFKPEVFMKDIHFIKATKILMQIMELRDNSEQVNNLQGSAASIFSELSKCKQKGNYSSLLSSIVDQLFSVICETTLVSNNVYIIDSYFSIIFDFLKDVVEPKVLGEYLKNFYGFMKCVIDCRSPHKEQIFEFLFINMTLIITQVNKNNLKFFANSTTNSSDFLKELYQSIVSIFTSHSKMISEGLMLMATIITSETNWGKNSLMEFLTGYIEPALKKYQETDIFKAAVESVSLCVKKYETELDHFAAKIYPYFSTLLREDVIQKDLKITLFFALSDFVLHVPQVSIRHLAETLNLAEMALQAVIHFQSSTQEDLAEYAEAFKETLIDFYLCLIHGIYVKTNDCDPLIETSMAKLIDFIGITSNSNLNPTLTYLNNCMGLIVDFYSKKKSPSLINMDVLKELYKTLERFKLTYPEVQQTLDYVSRHFTSL